MKITILVADDHGIVRDGLRALLESQSDMQIVALAENGRDAVRLAQQTIPHVAVLDIAMPELNGIEAALQIHRICSQTQIIILSIYASSEHIYRALHAGATGYLIKESAGAELISAVRAVAAGQRYLSQKISDTVLGDFLAHHQQRSPLESLSEREREVLQLTVEGKTAAQIAAILSLSAKTVETYRSRLMQKLAVAHLPALVRFAIQHGLMSLE